MEKSQDWRDRILIESEARYIEQVLTPALSAVRSARSDVEKQLRQAQGDAAKTAVYKAEIEEMNAFEEKVQSHLHSTLGRFSKRG
jgi:hypothetical protein